MAIISRIKQAIQKRSMRKGVFADNLRLSGKKAPLPPARHMRRVSRLRVLVYFALFGVLVLGGSFGLDSTFSRESRAALKELTSKTPYSGLISSEFLNLARETGMPLKDMFGLDVKTIVIDPGHGGQDPGTRGRSGLMEKDIALDIAKRLKEKLTRHTDLRVLLTRQTDETLPLNSRAEFANLVKGDLFISVHVNYLPSNPINIIETYYFGPSEDNNSLLLASTENKGSNYSLGDFKSIIEEIGNTLKHQESKKLASSIQDKLYSNLKEQDKSIVDFGIKQAPFVVLLGTNMPSVLAEVSCISNRDEEKKLNTDKYRDDIASYLENGILNYLEKGETTYDAKN